MERPHLATIDIRTEGADRTGVVVTVGYQDVPYEGKAQGEVGDENRPRLVAEATLRAVEKILGGRHRFDVEAIATTDLGSVRVAIAQVVISGSRESFVGSAVLREEDSAKAAARATLNAINRRLGKML
ncbi:MAG: hypothetical protein ACE5MI_06500 [Acidimicrobiia bacterium]